MPIINLMPFSTAVFFDEQIKSKIEELIGWAGRELYLTEFKMIKDGYRKCNFLHIDPLRPDDMRIVIENNFKYQVLQSVKRYNGFAHTHYKPESLEDALMFTAVCSDEESLKQFSNAYFRGDHRTIGLLLGYPKCDVEFFVKHWGEHLDLIYPTAMNSKKEGDKILFDPRLNIMLRYVHLRVIFHFPCSFQCKRAIDFSEIILSYLRKSNPTKTKELLDILSKPVIFSQVNGIIQTEVYEDESFKNPIMIIIQSGYSDFNYKLKMVPRWED